MTGISLFMSQHDCVKAKLYSEESPDLGYSVQEAESADRVLLGMQIPYVESEEATIASNGACCLEAFRHGELFERECKSGGTPSWCKFPYQDFSSRESLPELAR